MSEWRDRQRLLQEFGWDDAGFGWDDDNDVPAISGWRSPVLNDAAVNTLIDQQALDRMGERKELPVAE